MTGRRKRRRFGEASPGSHPFRLGRFAPPRPRESGRAVAVSPPLTWLAWKLMSACVFRKKGECWFGSAGMCGCDDFVALSLERPGIAGVASNSEYVMDVVGMYWLMY